MKKFFVFVLTLALAVSLLCAAAHAEAKNYVNHQWNADLFKGAIEFLEDGITEYTKINNTWYAPTIDVYEDLIAIMGDEDEMDVTLICKLKVRFIEGEENGDTTIHAIIRGYMPKALETSYGKDKVDKWNEEYEESLDGDEKLFINQGGNIIYDLSSISLTDSEWTEYRFDFSMVKGNLSSVFFEEMKMTFDAIRDYGILEAIQLKDFGLYLTDEYEADQPTPEPTPEPTATPEATAAPQQTAAPTAAPKVTDQVTTAPEQPEKEPMDPGRILSIGLIVAGVLLIATGVALLISVKKGNRHEQ